MWQLYWFLIAIYFGCVLKVQMVSAKSFTWREWWKQTVIYQIYPFSFMDSNGDGVGDLTGILSRLDYLHEIGIETVWITPIYESPMKDFGYDISNYTRINPVFGTMANFDELINLIHLKGMKLIMDFVPNHTSNEHIWFQKSRQSKSSDNPYSDYYVWRNPKGGCDDIEMNHNNTTCIPNNWISRLGGSSWTWDTQRQQYYYHQNLKEQPDLNYANPYVQEEMKDVLRFWFDRGVDGFRVDAIRFLFEDQAFADEPINPDFEPPLDRQAQHESLRHIYTADSTEVHNVVRNWRSEVFDKYSSQSNYRFMGTQSQGDAKTLSLFYGSAKEPEADFPFNYQMTDLTQKTLSGIEVRRLIDGWLSAIPAGAWPNWVFSDHGRDRIADRFGKENQRTGLLLNLLLPGTPNVYYEEEIGMSNTDMRYEDLRDLRGKNNPCCWQELNRDKMRSPMQWDTSRHAGFSVANKTWLPVNDNFLEGINVKEQWSDPASTLNLVKELIKLRTTSPALQTNTIQYAVVTLEIFSFLRVPDIEDAGNSSALVAINFSNRTIIADYTLQLRKDGVFFKEYDGVVALSTNKNKDGKLVDLRAMTLEPNEALVVNAFVRTEKKSFAVREVYLVCISTFLSIIFYLFSEKMGSKSTTK